MTVAVEPPAYFPPLRYLALFQHVDHFVLADTFRFRRQSFQNRSKLRNAQGGHWITIPVFGRREGAPLHTIDIETKGRWQEKHWRSFLYDYRSTAYFDHFRGRIEPFFEGTWEQLAACTSRSVALQRDLYGLDTPLTCASDLPGAPASRSAVGEALGAEELVLSMDAPIPAAPELKCRRLRFDEPTYRQNFEGFVGGVTAMDLLLNYGPRARRRLRRASRLVADPEAAPSEPPDA